METQNDFRRAYFVQTRQEIDTEKRERDYILYLVILVLGALGFAIIQSDKAQEFLKNPYSLFMDVGTVILILSLFWLRRMKMRQIADRWLVLHSIIKNGNVGIEEATSLEAIVTAGLRRRRYLWKDWVVGCAICLPIFCPAAITLDHAGKSLCWILVALSIAFVSLWGIGWLILMRPIRCPDVPRTVPRAVADPTQKQ